MKGELTARDIAERLDEPINTVRRCLQRTDEFVGDMVCGVKLWRTT